MSALEVPDGSAGVDPRTPVCLARQPILDVGGRVFGYELLYRPGAQATACTDAGDVASARVLTDAVLAVGLEALTGGRPAFLNFTRALLLSDAGMLLPPSSLVIELPASIEIDSELIDACRRLHGLGYALGLDDFTEEADVEALMPYVKFAKVDVMKTPAPARAALATRLSPQGVRLVAKRVETAEMAADVRASGYRLLQGYYFCQPTTFEATPFPANRVAHLDLLAALNRPNSTVEQLEDLVKRDLSLSYRVLRSVNSSSYGLRREVTSIRQALVLLGRDHIRNWASVWAMAGLAAGGDGETVSIALLRARSCELLGNALDSTDGGSSYFLLGLFSLLDVIIARPMAVALEAMPLSDAVKQALLGEKNQARTALDAAIAYERGAWDDAATALDQIGLPATMMQEVYADALRWTGEMSRSINAA